MNTRLSLLIREQEGRKLFEEIQRRLGPLLGIAVISRASLPDTDRIIQLHKAAYGNAILSKSGTVRRLISARESGSIGALLRCFCDAVREDVVYYTPKQSEYVGAMEVPIRAVLACFQDLLQFDGDSLQLTGKDEQNGLFLDWNKDEESARFEVVVWGEQWSNAASDCLQSTIEGIREFPESPESLGQPPR